MFKRIFLFLVVNVLVVLTISISLNLLGVRPYLSQQGLDYTTLLIFCSIVGFVGAFISLSLSKFTAKAFMGVVVIDPDRPASREEKFLVDVVYRLAQEARMTNMPEVGIYENQEVNAFATGPGKNNALVAVSRGLLERMDKTAITGVLAHEIAHVANGDMVTMTLLQGVVNTFVMFFARIAAWIAASALRGENEEDSRPSYMTMYLLTFLFELILSIFGSVLVAYFSRVREFAADRGGAMLGGKQEMIHALESLKQTVRLVDQSHQAIATLKISGNTSRFARLLATHPDLDERIARLKSQD